ncbi:TRAP transporter small permease [Salibacterium sp. K-3]
MEYIKKTIDKVLGTVCIGLFAFLVILVTWQVFTRFVLNNPSAISEELAKYCFAWLVLFGAAFVFGENGHMAILIMKDQFPKKLKMSVEVFIEIVSIVFVLLALIIGGYLAAKIAWNQMSASLPIPVGYLYAALPVSGAFMIFYCLYNINLILKKRKPLEQL